MSGGTLVAGVGNPWAGDLDFGPRFVERYAGLEWPRGVQLEPVAVAAQLFLHRLRELNPSRAIVVAAFPRGDAPGTIRPVHPADPLPAPEEIQARLGESAAGVIDLDHILIVNRYYGTLPPDTLVIEVEPCRTAFGTSVSAEVEACFQPVLHLVRLELGLPVPGR